LPSITFANGVLPTSYVYRPDTTFSAVQDSRTSFYNLSFTVPNTTQGVLQLDLEMGYRCGWVVVAAVVVVVVCCLLLFLCFALFCMTFYVSVLKRYL
jgi:hypothetical protein